MYALYLSKDMNECPVPPAVLAVANITYVKNTMARNQPPVPSVMSQVAADFCRRAMFSWHRFSNRSIVLVLGLLGILGIRALVLADKVGAGILLKPDTKLAELLTQAVDRLLIHVGLGNEFG